MLTSPVLGIGLTPSVGREAERFKLAQHQRPACHLDHLPPMSKSCSTLPSRERPS